MGKKTRGHGHGGRQRTSLSLLLIGATLLQNLQIHQPQRHQPQRQPRHNASEQHQTNRNPCPYPPPRLRVDRRVVRHHGSDCATQSQEPYQHHFGATLFLPTQLQVPYQLPQAPSSLTPTLPHAKPSRFPLCVTSKRNSSSQSSILCLTKSPSPGDPIGV